MEIFKHYISLGYFCSIAQELERFGLRDASYPFDWIISDIEGVFQCIDNKFDGLLDINVLTQSDKHRMYYKNTKYDFYFFHDFDKYMSLLSQIDQVKKKYERRIERFYRNIQEPTLFLRYISDEKKMQSGKPTELHWIENNFEKIQSTIKRYNQNNKIMFIANEGVKSDIIKIYCVIPDPNDTVARKPFTKNKLLYDYFSNIDNEQKSNNLKHYKAKMHKRNTLFQKFKVKMKNIYNKIFSQEYIHTQIYNENCQ